jgi:hypothetical protein
MTRRTYRRRNYNSKRLTNKDMDWIWLLLLFIWFWTTYYYNTYIKPNLDNIILFTKIFVPIIIIIIGLIIFYKIKKKKEREQEKIENTPAFLLELESRINWFKPLRNYKEEKLYQTELAGFLKSSYPYLHIEEAKDYSRPDIVIDNIAIEIKWPTNMAGLKSLPDKINSYLPKWDYLFIVLFNIDIVNDEEKNEEIYKQKIDEILENTIEYKREKIFLIRIG